MMVRIIWALVIATLPQLVLGESTNCSISIEELTFHQGRCDIGHTATGVTYIRSVEPQRDFGYWVQLNHIDETTAIAHWNSEYGASHAHSTIGKVNLIENCWTNRQARVCLDLPEDDKPMYRIEESGGEVTSSRLVATVDGIEYLVTNPNWENVSPATLGARADLDGDGRDEQIVYVKDASDNAKAFLSIVSYRGAGFFSFLDEHPINVSRSEVTLNSTKDGFTLQIAHQPSRNPSSRIIREYVVRSGKFVLGATYKTHAQPLLVKRFRVNQFDKSGESDRIYFDLNLDGDDDFVKCRRRNAADKLECESCFFSGPCLPLPACSVIGISRRISQGTHALVCDNQPIFLSDEPADAP